MTDSLARKSCLTLVRQRPPVLPDATSIVPERTVSEPSPTTTGIKTPRWFYIDPEQRRWASSLVVVLAAYASPMVWWLWPEESPGITTPPPAAMVVELAPAPAAPASQPDMPTGPQQAEATPPPKLELLPEPEPEIPPAPAAVKPEVAVEPKPEPKPEPKETLPEPPPPEPEPEEAPPKEEPPSVATAPPEAPQEDIAAAAPSQGVSVPQVNSQQIPNWQNRLMLKLNEAKRYPYRSRRYREEGVAYLRFTMDREGKVLAKSLERSSGHTLLDEETLELMDRAQPLPKPPAEMPGETLEFVVPVEFFLNR